jgi:WD40 repeat protein
VTASRDLTARLWDVASGDELAILRGHTAPLTDVAFSPDGRRIVTASTNKVARLWDAISGQQQAVLQGLNIDPVTGNVIPAPIKRGNPAPYYADFSPDGRFIVTSSSDGIASIWDATSGTSVAVPWAQTGRRVHRASFNSNSRRIVTVSDGLAAVVWDMVTGEELMSLWGHEDRITDAAFSHDDRLIVTASDDRTARIWEASNGAEQAVLRGHEKGLTYAAFSPDSLRIVTSSRDDSGRICDISGLQRAWYPRVVTEERRIEALFNKDGSRIITTADGSVSRLWDTATGNELTKSAVTFEPATAPDEDPVNGSTYGIITETLGKHSLRVPDAVCGNEGFVIQVDKSGLNTPPGGSSLTYSVSPDGQLIITTSWGGQVRLWDSIAGIEVAAIGRDDEVLSHSGFNPNGSRIITNAQGGEAWLWDLDKVESASEQLIRLRLGASSRLTEEEREISNLPPDDLIIDLSERLSELNPDDHINFGRLFSLGESGLEKDFSKALYHQAVAVIILESLGRADEAQQQRVLRANLARVVETEQLIDSWSMIGAWMAENGVEEFVY